MTEIGRMLIEEGEAKGKIEGKAEGKTDILIRLLIKKFGSISDEYKTNIKNLSEETIDIIAMEIFDMEKLDEVNKYFGK